METADDDGSARALKASAGAWAQHVLATKILREVASRAEAAGIEFMVVKGAVTSHQLYDDVAMRPMSDVDIRIRPVDFRRFHRMSTRAGWRCLRVARTYGNLVYHFPPMSLDVETQVGPPGLCALRVDDMLGRAVRLQIAEGLKVSAPEIHDHAILLTVNAFKDKIQSAAPSSLEDLARVVEHSEFRTDAFIDRVIRARASSMAWMIASWMESRGNRTWSRLREEIERRAPVRRRYARLLGWMMEHQGSESIAVRLLARAGADAPMMQMRAVCAAAAWEGEMWLRASRRL